MNDKKLTPMQSDEVKEFGLVIIESLRENDKKTGTSLHDLRIEQNKLLPPIKDLLLASMAKRATISTTI